MWVPFAEHIVRAFVHGMEVVVGAEIEGKFLQLRELKMRIQEDVLGCLTQMVKGVFEEIPVGTLRDADSGNEEGKGAKFFVFIGLHQLAGFENGHRAMADEIVELSDGSGDDAFGFVPRGSLSQGGFEKAAEEERVLPVGFLEVEEEIAVELAVAGDEMFENEGDDGSGLIRIGKSAILRGEMPQGSLKKRGDLV